MSKIYYKKINEGESYIDKISEKNSFSLTQSNTYCRWQKAIDRKAERFIFYKKDKEIEKVIAYIQFFEYKLWGDYNYYYAPLGPIVWEYSEELLEQINHLCIELNKKEKIVWTRLDFYKDYKEEIFKKYWIKTSSNIAKNSNTQPRSECIIDMNRSIDDIFNSFDKDTRYGIRTAEKRGIKTEIIKSDINKYLNDFLNIMSETTERNNFNFHNKRYIENIFNDLSDVRNIGEGFLSISRINNEIIAMGLFIIYNQNAYYLFAGSKTEYRKNYPGYAVINTAIKYIKENNLANNLSLGGVSSEEYPNNKLLSITDFKLGWSKNIINHNNLYDCVGNSLIYYLYKIYKTVF